MTPSPKRHRSPSYPATNLREAVKLAEKLYPAARHALGIEVICQQLGYKGLTSASLRIAALKYFGLLVEEKGGSERMLKLSPRGLDIGVDKDGVSTQRREAIREAATSPTLYAELWNKWGSELPPDAEIRRYLERDRGFNPKAVPDCIADYKTTLDYAGLLPGDIIGAEEDREENNERDHDPPSPPQVLNQRVRPVMEPGIKEDVFSLDEGAVVLQWPERLSPASAQDLTEWLQLIGRKIMRAVDKNPPEAVADQK